MTAASASVSRCAPRRASSPGSSAGRRKGWKTISTRPRRGSLWPRGQTLLPPRTVTGRIGTSASSARRAAPTLKRAPHYRPLERLVPGEIADGDADGDGHPEGVNVGLVAGGDDESAAGGDVLDAAEADAPQRARHSADDWTQHVHGPPRQGARLRRRSLLPALIRRLSRCLRRFAQV